MTTRSAFITTPTPAPVGWRADGPPITGFALAALERLRALQSPPVPAVRAPNAPALDPDVLAAQAHEDLAVRDASADEALASLAGHARLAARLGEACPLEALPDAVRRISGRGASDSPTADDTALVELLGRLDVESGLLFAVDGADAWSEPLSMRAVDPATLDDQTTDLRFAADALGAASRYGTRRALASLGTVATEGLDDADVIGRDDLAAHYWRGVQFAAADEVERRLPHAASVLDAGEVTHLRLQVRRAERTKAMGAHFAAQHAVTVTTTPVTAPSVSAGLRAAAASRPRAVQH